MDLCERVRSSCAAVVERATHVDLVDARLADLASECARDLGAASLPESPVDFNEDRAMRVLAADAINFGSGYHDVVRKEPGLSGARTMHTRLNRYLDASGPLNHSRLCSITPTDCSQIFGQELDGGALEELMTRFSVALNDLGSFIRERGGSAHSVLERCDHSAVGLAETLATMPFYADTDVHAGATVSFFKRAQITPADLHRAGLWSFTDLPNLTAFADNLVPHVLRVDGGVVLDGEVAARIDRGERLEPGSAAEVELRAAAVVAVERIVARIDRPDIWAMHVDSWLWERGGGPRYKAIPRPRSRTVFY